MQCTDSKCLIQHFLKWIVETFPNILLILSKFVPQIILVMKFTNTGFFVQGMIHMTLSKFVQFSRLPTLPPPPPLLSIYVENSTTHLTLNVQFLMNPPLPPLPPSPLSLQMITNQFKDNIIQGLTITFYQVLPSGQFLFSVSTH